MSAGKDESAVTIGFRGTEGYRWTLKHEATSRRLSVQAMLEEAVDLYLKIPPDKLDEVRSYVALWQPGKRRSKQKSA